MKNNGTPSRIALVILAPLPTILAVLAGGIFFINQGDIITARTDCRPFSGNRMVDAFMQLMWLNNFLRKSKAAANRIEELLAIPAMPAVEHGLIPREMTVRF